MYDMLLNIFMCLFQPLKDKNVCAPLPNLLNDIIDCLETMPGTGSMEVSIVLSFYKRDLHITMSWSCYGSQIFTPKYYKGDRGVQWLSGRVHDSRPRGHGFESQRGHCFLSLSKTHLS